MLKVFDFSALINTDVKMEQTTEQPPQIPVTILDMERASGCFDMNLQMADPCPNCGGFNMKVGDWVCWGTCYRCYVDAENEEMARAME
jgi:hypothetical protein